jgi:transcriptional regulator with XRE-family HTH domain
MDFDEEKLSDEARQLLSGLRENMDFASYLRMARTVKEKSKLEVAAKASIGKSTLNAAERGRSLPRPDVLDRLADALELDYSQRVYFLSLWAEEKIKQTARKQSRKKCQDHKRAIITPMTEEERAALELITGTKLPDGF